jgi:hypothetical protein
MTELMGWVIILGLAFAIVCIYMLSSQVERHMRDTAEIIISTNKLILAELKRLTDPTAAVTEPTVGVILERRCGHRRARAVPTSERAGFADQRKSPGRRREDLAVVRQAG